MNKESLLKVQERIIVALDGLDIPIYDRVELLINIIGFLNTEEYEDNIKVLRREREKKNKC